MGVLGLVLILSSCTLAGFLYDNYENKRILQLEELIKGLEILKSEIDYKLTPLIYALEEVADITGFGVDKLFNIFAYKLAQKDEVNTMKMWKQSIVEVSGSLHLKEDDYKILESFGSVAGHIDRELQKNNIDWVISKLRRKADEATIRYEKQSKLYKGIGILVGLSIVIVLI
ncbi:MAG: hypothetical protein BEN19_01565 [Epulopiscium sp. Nuni2H_MBin003]|nr:MAG: hypothetical protein BEN19_01565 [Epulopiscium sp. Nuni2H_MBin003]